MEGTHGQLRAGLTDRLGGDDAHRLAEVDELAGREHRAVAEAADAGAVLAGVLLTLFVGVVAAGAEAARRGPGELEVSTERTRTRVTRVLDQDRQLDVADLGVAGHLRAVGELHVLREAPAEQAALEQAGVLRVVEQRPRPRCHGPSRVAVPHDELLRDVDETTGQVAGVGGTEAVSASPLRAP